MKAVVLDLFIHLHFIQWCCQQLRLHSIIYTTYTDQWIGEDVVTKWHGPIWNTVL